MPEFGCRSRSFLIPYPARGQPTSSNSCQVGFVEFLEPLVESLALLDDVLAMDEDRFEASDIFGWVLELLLKLIQVTAESVNLESERSGFFGSASKGLDNVKQLPRKCDRFCNIPSRRNDHCGESAQ